MRMNMLVSTSTNNGGGKKKKKEKKKKKKKKKKKNNNGNTAGGLREGSYTDAVTSLSWNTVHQQVLASGSADGTVKLWDCTHSTSGKRGDCIRIRPSAVLTHLLTRSCLWRGILPKGRSLPLQLVVRPQSMFGRCTLD